MEGFEQNALLASELSDSSTGAMPRSVRHAPFALNDIVLIFFLLSPEKIVFLIELDLYLLAGFFFRRELMILLVLIIKLMWEVL